jgi:hypothetical protein
LAQARLFVRFRIVAPVLAPRGGERGELVIFVDTDPAMRRDRAAP